MAMALHVAADHPAVEHVERGEQRRRAVPFVVVRPGSGAALFEWQAGVGAVERMNLALFVDGQNDGVRWRIDIAPNDVAPFVDEAWVVRELKHVNPVRLETMGAPDSLGETDAETRCLRHQGTGPMGRLAGRIASRQGDNALGGFAPERLDTRGPRLVAQQTFEAFFNEPFLTAPDASLGFAGSPHDLVRADPIGGEQDDLSSPDVLPRGVAIFDESLEPTPIGRRNGHGFSHAHRADAHATQKTKIPKRDPTV